MAGSELGQTTGTCATAAAIAVVTRLFSGETLETVSVGTPAGVTFKLPVDHFRWQGRPAAAVTKNAGGDADITHGLAIVVAARPINEGIGIAAGEGVGTATRPGLAVDVGQPAINPVPRQMIRRAVAGLVPEGRGVALELAVPEGRRVARRTFNPRLGIEGGLSILGTRGVVRPMSEASWRRSLVLQLKQARALGFRYVALTPGSLGEQAALRLGVPQLAVAQMSNYVGYMVDATARFGFEGVILVGHLGKLVKVAGGHFNTHSRYFSDRIGLIAEAVSEHDPALAAKLATLETAEAVCRQLIEAGRGAILKGLADRVSARVIERSGGRLAAGTLLTNLAGEVVGSDEAAIRLLRRAKWSR